MPSSIVQNETVDDHDVKKYIVYHDRLNPKIWQDEDHLKAVVRLMLLNNAKAFYDFIDIKSIKLTDVILTGSNASYNYTPLSDLDVHLVVDFNTVPCAQYIDNFFNTKRTLWNVQHNVTIMGYKVELYVQDANEKLEANGVFSLTKNRWNIKPAHQKPEWDDASVVAKTKDLSDQIDAALDGTPDLSKVRALLAKIMNMRRAGLEQGGEFSTENLTYKALRNLGFIDRLVSARNKLQDRGLSSL